VSKPASRAPLVGLGLYTVVQPPQQQRSAKARPSSLRHRQLTDTLAPLATLRHYRTGNQTPTQR